jgi:hypothetical protein
MPVPQETGNDYEAQMGDGTPLVADDADVTVIAGHASRLAIDTLIRPEASLFPYPAYAIGLANAWIFSAPYDTWPIVLTGEEGWGDKPGRDPDAVNEVIRFIDETLGPPASQNEDHPAS